MAAAPIDWKAVLSEINQAASWGGGTDEYGNPTYTPSAALQATGAFQGPSVDSQGNRTYALPAAPGTTDSAINFNALPKTAAGTSIRGWTPFDSNVPANYWRNPNMKVNDPTWGTITPGLNFKGPGNDWLDKVGSYMPIIIATLMSAVTANPGMLAGGAGTFAGTLGTLGGTLFNDATKILFSKGGG
jgi:hypothetical protein